MSVSAPPSIRAVRASTSPYRGHLNDDAVAHPGWLDALVAAIEAPARRRHVRLAGAPVRRAPPGFRRHAGGARRQQQAARPRPPAGGFSGRRRGADPQRLGGALPPRHAGGDRRLRRRLLPLLRGYRPRPARALGRLEVPVRARTPWWSITTRIRRAAPRRSRPTTWSATVCSCWSRIFPRRMLLAAPFVSLARYLWHAWYIFQGRGSAARFRAEGNAGPKMIWYVLRAHAALFGNAGRLVAAAARDPRAARASPPRSSATWCAAIRISARRVAAL